MAAAFDPIAKEQKLREESESWDTAQPVAAEPGDVPVIDLREYLTTDSDEALTAAAEKLRHACETVGFWQLTGHGLDQAIAREAFAAARRFHALPEATKHRIRMDDGWPLGGVGYLPVGERKLPRRAKGNRNEAFLMKRSAQIGDDDNRWLPEDIAPGFRSAVLRYANAVEGLALQLVPIYSAALGVGPDHFADAFVHPFWRLRLTHYPPEIRADGEFGIAPHVDTTFFTLLLQDSPGLVIYSTPRDRWISVPVLDDAFVVNTGELLKQWTNDRFLSVRHFADSTGHSRYSIPFFFNAAPDHPMTCVPTCCGPENPAKYPPISYNQSQAVVQGE